MKKPRRPPGDTAPDNKRKRILHAMLRIVPRDGWTVLAYEEGLKSARIPRAEADQLMPDGIRDVIRLFGEETDAAVQTRITAERGFTRMRVRDKVAFAVRARLEALDPHREAMKRLLLWYALPLHAPLALQRLYRTVDLIWTAAGDTSTDYNFYTKRLLLAAVLKATMLFWLNDDSPRSEATWAFLDRRIAEVVRAGKAISLMKEWKPGEIAEMVREKLRRA